MTDELIKDLEAVARKHGMSNMELLYNIREMLDKEDRMEDISNVLIEEYPEVVVSEENLKIIYNRFLKSESAEYGTWDNIRSAIDFVKDELETQEVAE